jgi:YHS domain-containing protein
MKDPVCGMDVDEANATKVEHNGQTFYFCNDECAQKFKQSPDRYMQGQGQGGQRQQGQGGQGMQGGQRQQGQGGQGMQGGQQQGGQQQGGQRQQGQQRPGQQQGGNRAVGS